MPMWDGGQNRRKLREREWKGLKSRVPVRSRPGREPSVAEE